MRAIVGSATVLAVVLAFFTIAIHSAPLMFATAFVWGLVAFSLAAPLQIRVVNVAACAPNVASTLNQAAFNLGNAGGATLGAAALTAGFAYQTLPVIAVVLALAAIAVGLLSMTIDRRPRVGVAATA
jgi:DHA1 family inner membrane transport protein